MSNDKKLIITADDFGLSKDINQGIRKAILNGGVTSTTLLPNGPAYEHAVEIAKTENIPVGIHVGLVQEEPVSSPEDVSSLLDENGTFPPYFSEFLWGYFSGRLQREHLRREIRAQFEKVFSSGLQISHVDSHQHLHLLPGIFSMVKNLMVEFGISTMRIPDEWLGGDFEFSIPLLGLKALSKFARYRARGEKLIFNDIFRGVLQHQKPTRQEIEAYLSDMSPGLAEIGLHLSASEFTDKSRLRKERDLKGTFDWVMSPDLSKLLRSSGVTLTSWSDISNRSA